MLLERKFINEGIIKKIKKASERAEPIEETDKICRINSKYNHDFWL